LILRPEPTLAGVFDYLGVDSSAATIADVLEHAHAAEQRGQKGHQTSGGPEASIGRWRADLDDELKRACREAFDDILVELGYEETRPILASPGGASSISSRSRSPAAGISRSISSMWGPHAGCRRTVFCRSGGSAK